MYPTLTTTSNPYEVDLEGGFKVVGTSGQNTNDILRNSTLKSPMEALEAIVR